MSKNKRSSGFWIVLLVLAAIFIFYVLDQGSVNDELNQEQEIKSVDEGPPTKVVETGGSVKRTFTWNYKGLYPEYTVNFNSTVYEIYKKRSRSRDYDLFASDPYDDYLIKGIIEKFTDYGKKQGLEYGDIPYFVVSFIQSLPYTSDNVTSGYDEYPRFPYETLYDGGGDCEDTAILGAAILNEMNYGVALIIFKDHVGLGVKCSEEVEGHRYNYEGYDYCYLETTGENWDIGKLPEEYINEKARVVPIYKRPYLDIDFNGDFKQELINVYSNLNITIYNLGSETADNVKIYAALQTRDESKVWDDHTSEPLNIKPEEGYYHRITNLKSPVGEDFRIYVVAYGDNIVSEEVTSEWITWN